MPTLQYDFAIVGLGAINRAFATIEARMRQHNRFVDRSFGGRSGGGGVGGGAGGGGGRRVAGHPGDAAMVRKIKGAEAAERQRLREFQAIERGMTKVAQEEARKRARIFQEASRQHRRMQQVERRQAADNAKQARSAARAQAKMDRMRPSWAGRARKSLGRMGQAALGAAALGGGMLMSSAIEAGFGVEKASGNLAAQAVFGGAKDAQGKRLSFADAQGKVSGTAKRVGTATGINREEIVGGMQSFYDVAGDLDATDAMAGFFADLKHVAGVEMKDAGKLSGKVYMHAIASGLKGEKATRWTQEVVTSMTQQAAKASMSPEQFAQHGATLMSVAAIMGGDFKKNIGAVGAVAQASMLAEEDPTQAVTGVRRLQLDMLKNRDKFSFAFDKGGKGDMRQMDKVMMEMVTQSGGNIEQFMAKRGGGGGIGMLGMKPLFALQEIYKKGGGTKEEKETRLRQHMATFSTDATPETVAKGAAERRAVDKALQLEAAFNTLREEAGDKLVPEITKAIPAFQAMIPKIVEVVEGLAKMGGWFAENPFSGLGLLIGGAIVKEIAAAKIADIIAGAVKGGAGVAGTGGGDGLGNLTKGFGALGSAVGLATLALGGMAAWGMSEVAKQDQADDEAVAAGTPRGKIIESQRIKEQENRDAFFDFVTPSFLKEPVSELKSINMPQVSTGPAPDPVSTKELNAAMAKAGEDFAKKAGMAGDILVKQMQGASLNRGDTPGAPAR
jgi:hypothetical protein